MITEAEEDITTLRIELDAAWEQVGELQRTAGGLRHRVDREEPMVKAYNGILIILKSEADDDTEKVRKIMDRVARASDEIALLGSKGARLRWVS
jgi:hypothetical protein